MQVSDKELTILRFVLVSTHPKAGPFNPSNTMLVGEYASLAEMLGVPRIKLSGTYGQLYRRGLVRYEGSGKDCRTALTAAGYAAATGGEAPVEAPAPVTACAQYATDALLARIGEGSDGRG